MASELTTQDMARIYRAAFPHSRAWSAQEIAEHSSTPGFVCCAGQGFALGRVVLDEAELITIAVAPTAQRKGQGRGLLEAFERNAAQRDAERAFLEVAADNLGAIALYDSAGWRQTGRRAGYYARSNGPKIDALLYEKGLGGLLPAIPG